MSNESFREQYARATDYRKPAFIERPLIGSPAAPAQAETNVSNLWGHINAGYLIGYEYTRWWHESRALRTTAVLGDWSWLNKTLVKGPDAQRFMNYATVKDLSRQQVGQAMYTPMVNADGKVAIEGLTWRLADDAFLFTQSGARHWFDYLHGLQDLNVTIEDVTPDYTCYALQGPRSREVLEAVTGEDWHDLRFSRWRKSTVNGLELMVGRQGVTGEIGYEFLAPTDSGKAHELWRTIREVGQDFGLREIGLKAMMVGHIETGIATVVRDFLPARIPPDELTKFALLWMSAGPIPSTCRGTTSTAARRSPRRPRRADRPGGSWASSGTATTWRRYSRPSSVTPRRRRPLICPQGSSACSSSRCCATASRWAGPRARPTAPTCAA
jgi:glycine cleavage system aminomethyltransferase T